MAYLDLSGAFEKIAKVSPGLFRRRRLALSCATLAALAGAGAAHAATFLPYNPKERAGLWYSTQECLQRATEGGKWIQTGGNKCLVTKEIFDKQQKQKALDAPYDSSYVLHWIDAKGQIVLVPTIYISGIESNQISMNAPDSSIIVPDYWSEAMRWLEQLSGKVFTPPTGGGLGVALNSGSIRSEDQLHLHMCTVPRDLFTAIAAQKPKTDQWDQNAYISDGPHKWFVMKITKTDINPWQWVLQPPTRHNPAKADDHPNTGGIDMSGGDYGNKANVSMLFVRSAESTPQYYLLFNQAFLAFPKDFGSDAERLFGFGNETVDTKCNKAKAPQ